MGHFDLHKLLHDVFAPEPGERVVVLVDLPHDDIKDSPDWVERRDMAEEWREAFRRFGLEVHPLLRYPATGASNADLPDTGEMMGRTVRLADEVTSCDIAVAMTEFSATAPLTTWIKARPGRLRAASMPGVLRRMEKTALAADYAEVGRRARLLAERLTRADSAEVTFSTRHVMTFDLRHRSARADDGRCRRGECTQAINLPGGEAFIVPYEGERRDDPSRTAGFLPVDRDGDLVVLCVENNRIKQVDGKGHASTQMREYLAADLARCNIAELGLGCNNRAIVSGNVLEDEKAGMHWAYGRSEHLGGVTGPDAFIRPEFVVHHDVVYARGSPIGAPLLTLRYPDGAHEDILRDDRYVVF